VEHSDIPHTRVTYNGRPFQYGCPKCARINRREDFWYISVPIILFLVMIYPGMGFIIILSLL